MLYRKCWVIGLLGLIALSGKVAWAQVPPPPPASPTLWSFLGIPQAAYKINAQLFNRRGNFPGLEKKPPLKAIADVSNLKSEVPAIKAAAEIKQAEDLKPQKIKAIKYLATIGCGCYDKDEKVTKALLAAMEDCTEEVRLAAVQSVAEAAQSERCVHCKQRSCCNEKLVAQLSKLAYELDDSGCFVEPSERVRQAAVEAACVCCPGGPPPIVEEAPTPAAPEGTITPPPPEGTRVESAPPPPILDSALLFPPQESSHLTVTVAPPREATPLIGQPQRISPPATRHTTAIRSLSSPAPSPGVRGVGASMDEDRANLSPGRAGAQRAGHNPPAGRQPNVARRRMSDEHSTSEQSVVTVRHLAAGQASASAPTTASRELVTGHVVHANPDRDAVHLHLNEGGTLPPGTSVKIMHRNLAGGRVAALFTVTNSEPGWANARLTQDAPAFKIAPGSEFVAWR